jgi:mono/diheme cytochrome c family protein
MRLLAVILLFTSVVIAQSSVGDRIYKGKCAQCHSVDGSAASPLGRRLGLRDLRSPEVQRLSDNDLAEIIGKGRHNMPSFQKQLTSAQLSELVQYIRTLARTTSSAPPAPSK